MTLAYMHNGVTPGTKHQIIPTGRVKGRQIGDALMKILKQLLTDHPASVGETYLEHAIHAIGFGAALLSGAMACFLHALVPAICTTTGSRIVARLHDRMILGRSRRRLTARRAQIRDHFLAEHI